LNPAQGDALAPLTLDGEYIQGEQGQWLLTRWRALNNSTALLILPPFAEEMNCCRRVFAQLANQLTNAGIDCFLPDFYGTGDSDGDFSAISLQHWRKDILSFLPQLAGYAQVHLLGCRFGAALLLDWLPDIRQLIPAGQVLLWQPQLDAKRFWQQLQRLQQFGEPGGQAAATAKNTAETLYVAGYAIPRLLQAEAAALDSTLPADIRSVHWFETTLTGQLSAASLKLQHNEPDLQMQALSGQPYWLSQEPVDTAALLDATVAVVRAPQGTCNPECKAPAIKAAPAGGITTLSTACSTACSRTPQLVPLKLSGKQSLGIYLPADSDFLIVMVNGGAQTKAGSHRMQQLLAYHWQQAGFASLRFDFPGFGDAAGEPGDFIDHARYLTELPAELEHVFGKRRRLVLFGLCDGATAALLASPILQPEALLLLNPWCRLQQNHARTMLKFYYLRRVLSKEFWQKLIKGQLNVKASVAALSRFWQAVANTKATSSGPQDARTAIVLQQLTPDQAVQQAIHNWLQLVLAPKPIPLHLTLSGADLTAAECAELVKSADLQQIWQLTELLQIPGANHTLSGEGHCDLLMQATVAFMRKLPH
jgi:exosortase A-associated hydrolase 2